MKITGFTLLLLLLLIGSNISAQTRVYVNTQHSNSSEGYSGLNIGLGLGGYYGYYGYIGHTTPIISANYEFDVAPSFTLAPFVTYLSYQDKSSGGYYYHESVIPLGLKGTYYFDRLLNANSDWDFYLAGSLGFTLVHTRWDDGTVYSTDHTVNPLFLDLHVGAEYHLSRKVGLFLDLSTGVSTIGLAFH